MERITQTFAVTSEWEDERLDKFLAGIYAGQSRAYFQKLIRSGQVLRNEMGAKTSTRVMAGDLVSVCIEPAASVDILPEDLPLDILYEDEDILIVNKPKDMVVHPAPGHYTGTLVNAVMYHCRESLSGINGEIRPGIVHRIDKDTTGSLIICKNDRSHMCIARQLKEHSITRRYRGIVNGRIKDETGRIEATVGRSPNNRKKMAVNVPNGKPAVTHYKVMETFSAHTYMEFSLETGRTHQIRVHMASIGHPLLGDALYGPAKCPFHLQGQCLHAMTIGFLHPRSGEYVEFEAPLPDYFQKLLDSKRL